MKSEKETAVQGKELNTGVVDTDVHGLNMK